jgi:hypothetical protein
MIDLRGNVVILNSLMKEYLKTFLNQIQLGYDKIFEAIVINEGVKSRPLFPNFQMRIE